jgi:hypothetical protein
MPTEEETIHEYDTDTRIDCTASAGSSTHKCRFCSRRRGHFRDIVPALLEQQRCVGSQEHRAVVLPYQFGCSLRLGGRQPIALALEMDLL